MQGSDPMCSVLDRVFSCMNAVYQVISCVVPDKRKAAAVTATLNADVSTACPATVLRKHGNTVLWLDTHSASDCTEDVLSKFQARDELVRSA